MLTENCTVSSSIQFLSRVAERAGLEPGATGTLTQLTLRALGGQLHARQAVELAQELPPTLASWLVTTPSNARGLTALLAEIAPFEPGSLAFTLEHVESVCLVLADTLRPEALRALTEALPADVAALLVPRSEPTFERVPVDSSRRTLAEADAASEHPIYRSPPPERAHSQSVARAKEPHAETKLSSAHGLTQEREHETLAEGRPYHGR
jgi:uncharacterized protein (DUF2267 family)